MTTTIISNGGCARNQPIEGLFARLESDTLCRSFEAYGNFIQVDPVNLKGEPFLPMGGVCFFGNFATYSHVFNIHTDDADLIERLTAAIRANQTRPEYLAQKPPHLIRVTWFDPQTQTAGELVTRNRLHAEMFARAKRTNGCDVKTTEHQDFSL